MTLLLSFLLGTAQAQTYTVDFAIPMTTPVNYDTDDEVTAFRQWGVASGYSDQTVASSWSYIDCIVEGESLRIEFSATPGTWPSSFPSSATCSAGGYTLTMNLEDIGRAPDGDMSFTPSTGVELDLASGVGHVETLELPSGPSYVDGNWDARLDQTTVWSGVRCAVGSNSGGDHFLRVYAKMGASADEGYCVIQSGSGIPHLIPLTITR